MNGSYFIMAAINEDIKQQLELRIPDIEERFVRIVRYQLDAITQKYKLGVPNGFYCISNDWTFARVWNHTVRPFVKHHRDDETGKTVFTGLDEEKLAKEANEYAKAVALAWFDKINEKIGELADAKVVSNRGSSFTITGERAGKIVVITQDMIINVSSKGLMFNQFPARIKVDGKAYSAAAYKKLF